MTKLLYICAVLIFMVFYLYAVFGEELKPDIQTVPVYCDNCNKQLQIYHNLAGQKYCDGCFYFIKENIIDILKTKEGEKILKELNGKR